MQAVVYNTNFFDFISLLTLTLGDKLVVLKTGVPLEVADLKHFMDYVPRVNLIFINYY